MTYFGSLTKSSCDKLVVVSHIRRRDMMNRRTTLGSMSQSSMNARAGNTASRQSLGPTKSRASIATATFSSRSRVSNAGRKSSAAGMAR